MNKNSLIVKHGISIILFAVLFIVGITATNTVIVNNTLKKAEQEKIKTAIKTVLPTIAINLSFGFNEPVNEQLHSFAKINNHVASIRIRNTEHKILFAYHPEKKNHFDKQQGGILYYSESIMDQSTGEDLGTIEIAYSNQHYKELLYDYLKITALIIAISALALFIFLRNFYKKLKPLRTLAVKLDGFNPTDASSFKLKPLKGHDEVAIINNTAQKMIEKIEEYYGSLNELNKNLRNKVAEEVEKNRKKDQMMIQQSRFAALGEMIGNIAHQWRQPLNVISLEKDMLVELYYDGELNNEKIENFQNSTNNRLEYMSQTIDNFRNFFTPDKKKSVFQLEQAVEDSFKIVFSSIKKHNIAVKIRCEDHDHPVFGHPNEFKQVLINIFNNARDVIIEKDLEEGEIDVDIYKKDGKEFIKIEDNAGGIPEDIIGKVFDPYFTTKFKSQGTGLGLYMSKIIIENTMKGTLTVINSDRGAVFIIELNGGNSKEEKVQTDV